MVSDPGKASPHAQGPKGDEHPDRVLEAKYLDFCSARVAEGLLALTADEMYVLAEEALADSRCGGRAPGTYQEIVRLATERICGRLSLPSFEDWVQAYRTDPEKFEREMIGLWESDLSPERAKGPGKEEGQGG